MKIEVSNKQWGGERPNSVAAGLDNFSPESNSDFSEARTAILERWTGHEAVGLFLYGPPGTGKSTAAASLAMAILADPRRASSSVYWAGSKASYSGVSSVLSLTLPVRNSEIDPQNCLAEDIECSIVVFDDFGNPQSGKLEDQQCGLVRVVHEASSVGGLVIVTSNLSDPFASLDPAEATAEELQSMASFDTLQRIARSGIESGDNPSNPFDLSAQRESISAALKSRMASMFKFIEFSGEDLRQLPENSFWG